METVVKKLDQYTSQCIEAVGLLHQHHMYIQAITLALVYIDHMSWIAVDDDAHSPSDFKEWVDRYLTSKNPIGCNSNDLWEARNGIVHMGTSESNNYVKRGADKIHFYRKLDVSLKPDADFIFIDIDMLIGSFAAGILHFRLDVENQRERHDKVRAKLDKLLINKLY